MKLSEFSAREWIVQGIVWLLILAGVGFFSRLPAIEVVPVGKTEIQLVVRYSGKRLGECRELTGADLEKLPPNMRAPMVCPREKSPLYAELEIGGQVEVRETVNPSGLHNDGVLAAYHRITVDAGSVDLSVRIRDDESFDGFTHVLDQKVTLSPDKVLTVHFTDDGFRLTGAWL